MSIPIQFKFDGAACIGFLESVQRSLATPNAKGLKRGFEDMGTVYLQFLRRRYQRLSGGGGVWPRLKPATVRQKGGNSRILIRSGRLYGSLLRASPDCVFAVDRKGLTFGTMVPYATFHQTGTSKMRRRQVYVKPDPRARALMKSKLDLAINTAMADAASRVRNLNRRPAA